MADDEYLLRYIPGEYLGAAAKSLPDPERDTEKFREVVVDVPGRFIARVSFERFHFKRGKMSRWFWTPHHAEKME